MHKLICTNIYFAASVSVERSLPPLVGMNAERAVELIERLNLSLRTEIVTTDFEFSEHDLGCDRILVVVDFNNVVIYVEFGN